MLSANQRLHWAVRMRRVEALRGWGGWLARDAGVPRLRCAVATVVVHPGMRTRRIDPSNYADTSKALIDGCVDAGVLVDDSGKYLTRVTFVKGGKWPKTGVELVIRGV